MDCSLPSFTVLGVSQARILEWIAISSSRGSSWPRDWICISWVSCIDRQVFYHWTIQGNPIYPFFKMLRFSISSHLLNKLYTIKWCHSLLPTCYFSLYLTITNNVHCLKFFQSAIRYLILFIIIKTLWIIYFAHHSVDKIETTCSKLHDHQRARLEFKPKSSNLSTEYISLCIF